MLLKATCIQIEVSGLGLCKIGVMSTNKIAHFSFCRLSIIFEKFSKESQLQELREGIHWVITHKINGNKTLLVSLEASATFNSI